MHPLVSLVNNIEENIPLEKLQIAQILSFHKISYKMNLQGRIKYGRYDYDFEL